MPDTRGSAYRGRSAAMDPTTLATLLSWNVSVTASVFCQGSILGVRQPDARFCQKNRQREHAKTAHAASKNSTTCSSSQNGDEPRASHTEAEDTETEARSQHSLTSKACCWCCALAFGFAANLRRPDADARLLVLGDQLFLERRHHVGLAVHQHNVPARRSPRTLSLGHCIALADTSGRNPSPSMPVSAWFRTARVWKVSAVRFRPVA